MMGLMMLQELDRQLTQVLFIAGIDGMCDDSRERMEWLMGKWCKDKMMVNMALRTLDTMSSSEDFVEIPYMECDNLLNVLSMVTEHVN